MRLIDANAFKKENERLLHCDFPYLSEMTLEELIDEAPTIDAVQVIRCKDCIHNVANRKTDPIDITDYSGQDIVCDYFMTDGQEPDDYCSKAEPKERTGEQ